MERKTAATPAIAANPNANSVLAAVLLLAVLLVPLLLSGCINPNSNLSYSSCCKKSDTPYTCSVRMDNKGEPVAPDKDGLQELSGCGSTCAWLKSDGKVYQADKTTEVADLTLCANNCNFRSSDCKDDDGKHTCYLLDAANSRMKDKSDQPIAVAPICAEAKPNPCIQNQCKARMCGEPVPAPKGRMDSDSVERATDQNSGGEIRNSYKDLAQSEQPGGLVGKICNYTKMDKRANRLLNAKDWFVDALRLGVGGTFSDYDRARFYLPPSDFYCSRTTPGAVVDRFTMYLDGDKPLKEFLQGGAKGTCTERVRGRCQLDGRPCDEQRPCKVGECIEKSIYTCSLDRQEYGDSGECERKCREEALDFHAPLSLCKAKLTDANEVDYYYCDVPSDPPRIFSVASLGSPAAALLACNNACNWNRFKTCKENSLLLTSDQTVSPPGVTPAVQWPFTDINAYATALSKAYPTPPPNSNTPPNEDPRDYYKPLLPPTLPDGSPNPKFQKNQALTGPAGAKVFECSSNGDCLSGQCDQNSYLRGSCFLNDAAGTPVDCGCHYVTDCKREYPCEALPDGGVPKEICISNRDRCRAAFGGDDKKDGAVLTVCDYRPTTLHVFAYYWGLPGGNAAYPQPYGEGGYLWVSRLNFFPCAPYDANNVSSIEFANRQVYASNTLVCNNNGVLAEPVCKTGEWSRHCNEFEENIGVRTWIGWNCDRTHDYSHENHLVFGRSGDYRAGAACTVGSLVNSPDVSAWRDNDKWDADIMRWGNAWGNDLYTVPDRPVVAGPYSYSVKGKPVLGVVFTSKSVHFCFDKGSNSGAKPDHDDPNGAGRSLSGYYGKCSDSEPESCTCDYSQQHEWKDTKFKLIQACNMKVGTDIVLYRPDENDPNAPIPPDWRGGFAEKTWLILGFGDCQVANGQPVLASYGICRPCSTSLTIASQDVAKTEGYCPAGCNFEMSYGQVFCDCSKSDYRLPLSKFPQADGPNTNPDYGFLVGKINEYQRANILPLLDLRQYDFSSRNVADFFLPSGKNCEEYGAINGGTVNYEVPGSGGKGGRGKRYYSRNICKARTYPNFLLGYLASNHSAAILDVANLPDAASGPDKTYSRVSQAKTGCPDCLIALEYPAPIPIETLASQPYGYPQELNDRVKQYSNGVEFNPLRMDPPVWPDEAGQREVGKVSLLILNIDLSGASSDPGELDGQISHLINLSRRTLQHVGWPTIYKLTYARGQPGALADEKIYKALYARQAELTLTGVGGILLPPLDNAAYTKDPEDLGKTYSGEGQLLDDGAGGRARVKATNTPFCAAENGSTAYLHPKIMVGLQKLYTRPDPGCGCAECSALQIAAGLCKQDNNLCWDGKPGHNEDRSVCEVGKQMCEPFCVNDYNCPVVNESALADKKTTCTALRSTNELPVLCAEQCVSQTDPTKNVPPNSRCWPDCDIQEGIPLKELANDTLHPDAAYLIAGLPHANNAFCLRSETAKYTYRAAASVDMVSEPVLFPAFGSNISDCGRIRVPGIDETQVACGTPLPPVLDTLWSCTTPT